MRAGNLPPTAPAAFAEAVTSLRSVSVRAEVVLTETPAPTRLAPHAFALGAEVVDDGLELATGRLVLLYDPAGDPAWGGPMRIVAFVRADLEHEIATDPFLGGVGWSWLLDALGAHGAAYAAAGGTVTRAASESFGAMAGRATSAEVEVRASWTPLDVDLSAHLRAWCDVLCYAGGLPPVAPGVAPLPPPRKRAGGG
ncbi:MAG: DUF3000 domain-containing protein [Frankiaceae bacterium]